jgi:beta-catenin-like protein 1
MPVVPVSNCSIFLVLKPSINKQATSKKGKREWLHLVETQTIRILHALTRHLDDSSPYDAKTRLISKFLHGDGNDGGNDDDKCDRLVELLLSYDQKARKAEYNFYRFSVDDDDDVQQDETMIELAALEAKLKGGGEIFHRLGAIAACLCVNSKRCHERILAQLQLQQSGISVIKAALEEFVSVLGPGVQKEQLELYLTQI